VLYEKKFSPIAALASAAFAGDSLDQAFKDGKFSGDLSAFSETRHVNNGEKSIYYNNTSYVVGSVSLNYETAPFYDFKLVTGFRAAAPFWQRHKNLRTLHGKGDSTERIYENDRVLLSNLYLEYSAFDTVVKIGRQEMVTDWIGRYNDGVRITNNSISNLTIDALWTRAQGRATNKEMWGFTDRNKDHGGVFNVGATYKFDGGFSAKAYVLHANDVFTGVGGKVMFDGQINDDWGAGGMIHYAQSDEKKIKDDGKMFEATAYAKFQDHKLTLGYAKSGKAIGWGSLNLTGDHIVPLEEGDRAVICTDGVHGVLSDSQMCALVAAGNGPQGDADALVRAALEGGTRDNATAVVVYAGTESRVTLPSNVMSRMIQPVRPASIETARRIPRRKGSN